MSVKQRIESLEEHLLTQGVCPHCGGLHTRNWVEAMRAAVDEMAVCACPACCGWLAELKQ